jgi:nitrogen fixation protein NifB
MEEPPAGVPFTIEMEGKTKYRVAVASSDGRSVDQGFGQTDSFYSYQVEVGSLVQLGKVKVEARLDEPVVGAGHRRKLEDMANALKGYDAVVATEFGERAVQSLKDKGIAAFQMTGEVEKAVLESVDNVYKKRAATFE